MNYGSARASSGAVTAATAPYGATFLSDIITRPEFLGYVQEAIYERSLFVRSGAVVRNTALDARAGGVKVEVPTWRPINPVEEQIKSSADWGTSGQGYLTPQRLTAGKQIAPIMHRGFAYAADDLSVLGSGGDPLAAMRVQLADAINKLKEITLLNQLEGLFKTAIASNSTDIGSAVVPGSLTNANFLSAATAIQGKSVLGERADQLNTIVMPSAVYFYLQQTGMLTFSSDSLSGGTGIKWGGGGIGVTDTNVAWFAGMRVIVTDNIGAIAGGTATHAKKYPVYMLGSGSIAEGVQQELRIEADRNILAKEDVVSVDYHYGYHLGGTSYVGADNPTNALLATNTSWSSIYTDKRNIAAARLVVNTPFGGAY